MAPKYKLIYFDAKARAEVSRLLFAAAGVPFEDVRVDFHKEWPAMKAKTPQGIVPVLEVDGGKLVLSQSGTISRYLARTFKLYGKNDDEAAIIDLIYDTVMLDLFPKHVSVFFEQDETKKAALKKELDEKHIPHFLDILEQIVLKHGKDGFAVGRSLTLADAALFVGLEFATAVPALNANKDKYGSLLTNREKFEKIPKIKAWLDKRPETNL